MSKNSIIAASAAGVAIVAAVAALYSMRIDSDAERKTRVAVRKEVAAQSAGTIVPYLEKLSSETSFRTWETRSFPWIGMGKITRVPFEYIGQMTEEQFIRFAGDGTAANPPNAECLKALIAFAKSIIPKCPELAANALRERSLDGMFLAGDYDSAITLLETEGIPKRSKGWCISTAAKLRYHKAMEAKDLKEAIAQLDKFIAYMLSDEQKDFEDCDPTTGILYSREWVAAKNQLRCSNMAKELGDSAASDKYFADAKKNFAAALVKAKDDEKSLKALQEEVKAVGL